MIKQILTLVFFGAVMLSTSSLQASQVPIEKAKEIAKTAFAFKSVYKEKSAKALKITASHTQMIEDKPAYYIFNMEPKGFIIISAEDKYNPVLAFSDESTMQLDDETKMVPIFGTLHQHEQHIAYIQQNAYKASPQVQREWDMLNAATVEDFSTKDDDPEGMIVAPLTTTLWNQDKFYNSFTPEDDIDSLLTVIDGRTYCGCAPIAMSQLMKFHNYPKVGNGQITYKDSIYGPQSANFCREYNWENMPDSLTDYNDDVAEFIYHVGVSTQTQYSTFYTATYVSYMRDALVNFWNYHTDARWFYDLNNEFAIAAVRDLNQGRPLMLTGSAYNNGVFGGAHMWVADGYGYFLEPAPGQPDIYFHFNWGWGGDNNGWFLDAAGSWAPIPFSTGIGPITYYWDRYVVHNIYPAENGCSGPSLIQASAIRQDFANLRTNVANGYDRPINFRYREVGDVDWIVLPETEFTSQSVSGLTPETEYEYQARQQCCEGTWSEYSTSQYFTTASPPVLGPCELDKQINLTTTSVTENSAYIYTSRPYGLVNNQFRYRYEGSFLWFYTDVSNNYYRFLTNLQPATNYEFQVRHVCDAGEYTEYTESGTFTTAGNAATCAVEYELDLFTSSTTETRSYIYTSQPYGKVDNRFRYRAVGASDWSESTTNDSYYRYLTGLAEGTDYEFQVQHLCDGVNWTDWSYTYSFRTLGGVEDCDVVSGDRLYTSSVTNSLAYIYTPQPYGQVANQFRYRRTGEAAWINTTVSTLYYRLLANLQPSANYEFQVAHECAIGNWSDWSTSQFFTTGSGIGGRGVLREVLPPRDEDVAYSLEQDVLSLHTYPNPTTAQLTIIASQSFSAESQMKLMDISGRVVKATLLTEGTSQETLDLSNLDTGMYMLHYTDGQQTVVQRIIKN